MHFTRTFVKTNPHRYYLGEIGTHDLCHSRADVLPLGYQDCPVTGGSLNHIAVAGKLLKEKCHFRV